MQQSRSDGGAAMDSLNSAVTPANQARAHNSSGLAQYTAGRYQAAVEEFSAALAIMPDHAQALANRSNARYALGDLDGAREDCESAIQLQPVSAELLASRGAIFLAEKKWAAAIAECDRALVLKPGVFWIHVLRGSARYHSSEGSLARGDFEAAFALNPGATARLVIRTLWRTLQVDSQRVLADCATHLQKKPNDLLTLLRRGLTLLLMNRDAEAADDLERVRVMLPPGNRFLPMLMERARNNRPEPTCQGVPANRMIHTRPSHMATATCRPSGARSI